MESSSRSTYCNWQCFKHDSGSRRIKNFFICRLFSSYLESGLWKSFGNYLRESSPHQKETSCGLFSQECCCSWNSQSKAEAFPLPKHNLVVDVATRWNSALDMISRYLEQQPAIYAVLTSEELCKKKKDVPTLSERDLASAAKELVAVLKPLKIGTTALCEESVPALSMILPLKHRMVGYIMREKDDDLALIKQVKKEVVDDSSPRYHTYTKKDLTVVTLLDPCFKSTPFINTILELQRYIRCIPWTNCASRPSQKLLSRLMQQKYPSQRLLQNIQQFQLYLITTMTSPQSC